MDFLFTVVIFLIVAFIYVHVMHQYKKSEDMEIYEMDYSTNTHLQEICDIRQPISFQLQPQNKPSLKMEHLGSYEVRIKDVRDYDRAKNGTTVESIAMPYHSATTLMETDTNARFFTENNDDFMEETGSAATLSEIYDEYLKPAFTVRSHYDLLQGSKDATTPLRYHTDARKFHHVTSGKIRVKMTPWKSRKYLHPYKDMENYEFRSPMNPWKPQQEYLHDYDKTRFLEFDVHPGYMLYIPSYWWYSIEFIDNPIVYTMTYNTAMSYVANAPDLVLYFLQQQNITKKISKATEPTRLDESVPDNTPVVETAPAHSPQLLDEGFRLPVPGVTSIEQTLST